MTDTDTYTEPCDRFRAFHHEGIIYDGDCLTCGFASGAHPATAFAEDENDD